MTNRIWPFISNAAANGSACNLRAWLLIGAFSLQAQNPNPAEVRIRSGPYAFPQTTISVQANLVESGVTVRDRRGVPVGGFTADDFEIFDNGKPQEIAFFSVQGNNRTTAAQATQAAGTPAGSFGPAVQGPPPPRSLALFFDDTHASMADCHRAVLAAEKVLAEAQPMDRIALYTGSGSVTLDFTTDREKLRAALARIKPHWTRNQLDTCVTMDPYQAYSIANHLDFFETQRAIGLAIRCNCPSGDPECVREQPAWVQDASSTSWAIYKDGSVVVLDVLRIAVDRLAAMPEGRILVLLSRGFVTGGMDGEKSAIVNAALRAHIVLNALNTEGLSASLARSLVLRQTVLEEMMAGVSSATGGQYIKNNNDLTGALRTLSKPPEVSYTLGFMPAWEPDGNYHTLKVRLKNGHGYEVDARQGYMSEKVKPAAETAQRRIDDAVLSTQDISEIPATLQVTLPDAKTQGRIAVKVTVDARELRFLKKSGRSMQELTFVMVMENAAGEHIAGKQAVMDLALTNQKLASMQATGVKAVMTFAATPGKYSIRAIVREAGQNKIAASTARFEIQ
jgi:VWFA-related protein